MYKTLTQISHRSLSDSIQSIHTNYMTKMSFSLMCLKLGVGSLFNSHCMGQPVGWKKRHLLLAFKGRISLTTLIKEYKNSQQRFRHLETFQTERFFKQGL